MLACAFTAEVQPAVYTHSVLQITVAVSKMSWIVGALSKGVIWSTAHGTHCVLHKNRVLTAHYRAERKSEQGNWHLVMS